MKSISFHMISRFFNLLQIVSNGFFNGVLNCIFGNMSWKMWEELWKSIFQVVLITKNNKLFVNLSVILLG